MFMLGSMGKDEQSGSLHSPTLVICEDALLLGVKVFASMAMKLCATK
jgi:metal-dependent amidase/aminoacylase/carboxypeptidase family protein